jgi:lysozyme
MTVILGADISSYQPSYDFPIYLSYGRKFVMIKATEGTAYRNPQFTTQVKQAEAAGVAVGCTHYYAWGDPAAEARFFVRTVQSVTTLQGVPLAGDFERGAYDIPVNGAQLFAMFLSEVQILSGYPLMVYSTTSFLSSFGITVPAANGQWVADWDMIPPMPLPGGSFWAIWQHATNQAIPGIDSPVDSDIFNGTVEQFRAYGGR